MSDNSQAKPVLTHIPAVFSALKALDPNAIESDLKRPEHLPHKLAETILHSFDFSDQASRDLLMALD
jgi:hypothetical protein